MGNSKVYILGGDQTDFAVNWSRQNLSIADLLSDSFTKAIDSCKIDQTDIQSIHVGNFVAELFCGQGHLGAMLSDQFTELEGVPASRHEAACASGSMAILAAMREIEVGLYDLIAVSGVEMMKNVDGKTASQHLGAAAKVGYEATEALYPWVYQFSEIKEHYHERYGVKHDHLAEIAKINYQNATRNPNAQTRHWELADADFLEEDSNPIVERSLRKSDCARITDGSATIFLASEKYATAYTKNRNIELSDLPYIKGWGHTTTSITLKAKLEQSHLSEYPFPHVRRAITDAYDRAKISSPADLDVIETHDCFTISEYAAIDHFGISAGPGKAWQNIENGDISFNGKIPINPSGGLIGLGHPVGATGVRMMLDAYKQSSGKAGEYQVDNAKNVGILNIGGSFTTVASFVVGH